MQITINLKTILEKLRYILLGIILLITFIFRSSTPVTPINDSKNEEEQLVQEETEIDLTNESLIETPPSSESTDTAPLLDPSSEEIEKEKAVVLSVIDGDTVKLQFSGERIETVHMLLIDTPESVKEGVPVQPFALEASQRAKELMIKDTVVEVEVGEKQYDGNGRLLAHIWVDELNINLQLVAEGFARVAYVNPPNTKYVETFYEAQEVAKNKKLNIWQEESYVQEDGFHAN
ncbi:endonuclease YncB(thermonuclease family) [Ureibacillus xyleni]|uniref:Endonuclease YncB( thermonuclease family) n=1 Tax=Ureibacillus xyleni TaxID=614648 RepID=A0A285THC8_9BACL|nr:thermonuclease family protein [Ureibacillus xyleni]SOC21559.1 endonuclease YncB(thermonuclease family) [Ureibacillus xyleni]